jgi:hypothetical protein
MDPRFAGSNPAGNDEILRAINIVTRLPLEVK